MVEFEFFYIVGWGVVDEVGIFGVGYKFGCVEIVDVILFIV